MLETLLSLIDNCKNDVYYSKTKNKINIDLYDFEGFDDDWNEVFRDYDNPDSVKELCDWLENNCISKKESLYSIYYFDNFSVELGRFSFDI